MRSRGGALSGRRQNFSAKLGACTRALQNAPLVILGRRHCGAKLWARAASVRAMVQRKHGAFAFAKDCLEACCAPDGRKQTVNQTTPLSADSRHAFLQHEACKKLPRDVLLRIFALAATVERRVVTVTDSGRPSHQRRWQKISAEPEISLAFAGLCVDDDDAPP